MSDHKLFFNHLHIFFLSRGDLTLGGDFNCIDFDLDRLHIKSDFSADKHCLSALKSDFCLVDIFRKQNPKAISFTWSNKDLSQASRLDRFYISSSLLQSGDMLITFANACMKNSFIEKNVMEIRHRRFAINDEDQQLTYLNIYAAQHELSDNALIRRLE